MTVKKSIVSLTNYQEFVADGYTNPSANREKRLFNAALGICGESGEVADLVKKLLHGKDVPTERFVEEVGDVIWYLAHLCHLLGISLNDVIRMNYVKLRERYPEQYGDKFYELEVPIE
jgi:NTP pyrophosphatase (non-canonical NTP hydrolase)